MSLVFAILTLYLMANQVASGLALTIFGIGLSAFMGIKYTSVALNGVPELHIPILSDIPILGRLVFSYDILIYLSLLILAGVAWFLYKTRAGTILRAIGESPKSGHALGFSRAAFASRPIGLNRSEPGSLFKLTARHRSVRVHASLPQ